jgi:ribosomal protein L20
MSLTNQHWIELLKGLDTCSTEKVKHCIGQVTDAGLLAFIGTDSMHPLIYKCRRTCELHGKLQTLNLAIKKPDHAAYLKRLEENLSGQLASISERLDSASDTTSQVYCHVMDSIHKHKAELHEKVVQDLNSIRDTQHKAKSEHEKDLNSIRDTQHKANSEHEKVLNSIRDTQQKTNSEIYSHTMDVMHKQNAKLNEKVAQDLNLIRATQSKTNSENTQAAAAIDELRTLIHDKHAETSRLVQSNTTELDILQRTKYTNNANDKKLSQYATNLFNLESKTVEALQQHFTSTDKRLRDISDQICMQQDLQLENTDRHTKDLIEASNTTQSTKMYELATASAALHSSIMHTLEERTAKDEENLMDINKSFHNEMYDVITNLSNKFTESACSLSTQIKQDRVHNAEAHKTLYDVVDNLSHSTDKLHLQASHTRDQFTLNDEAHTAIYDVIDNLSH